MAKHLNNEPYLHFKAYNGLGSTQERERKSWERQGEGVCEREGEIACNLFYGTGACTLNAHLITRTRRGCCLPPLPYPPRGDKSNWFRLFASSRGFNAALLNHFYCHWNVQKFCATPPCPPTTNLAAKKDKGRSWDRDKEAEAHAAYA